MCKYKQSQVVNMRKKLKVAGSRNTVENGRELPLLMAGRGAAVSKLQLLDGVCVCVG